MALISIAGIGKSKARAISNVLGQNFNVLGAVYSKRAIGPQKLKFGGRNILFDMLTLFHVAVMYAN